jgi:predicted metalloprotease with PDZ domain
MVGDLLWVYEGLTEYLGDILAARCGIWTPEQYRDRLAVYAANYEHRPGRTWRPLEDTARMAQVLYSTGGPFDSWRRGTDFYDEGELIWLDVDVTIRRLSHGAKSLNDFTAAFHGLGGNTMPKVVPYTFEDVVAGLNGVVANDWAKFLKDRLTSLSPAAPLGGITGGGYKLVYRETTNSWTQLEDGQAGSVGFWSSLGLRVANNGQVGDVLHEGVADHAGIGPGMKLVAVNGREFDPQVLRAAVKEAKGTSAPIELIVANTGFYKIIKLEYHGGEQYPALERVEGTPDYLDEILKPMTK